MMAETTFRSPGFFEREIDLSSPATAGITGVPVGVIGTAEVGPAFVPVTVGNVSQLQQVFGAPRASDVGLQGASQYLENGSALTFVRILGCGANSTTSDFSTTVSQGTVKNSGFIIKGTTPAGGTDTRHKGATQYITAKHWVSASADVGYPIFTDNDSFGVSSGDNFVHLVRGMIMLASGTRMQILDHNQAYSLANTTDDTATIGSTVGDNLYRKFKLVISSSAQSYATGDGQSSVRILTASLDPADPAYISNILNTDPARFETEEHLLYADFPVESEVAIVSTGTGAVAILSGSASTSLTSGDTSQSFRDAFGRFDTRYSSAKTTHFISQPYGASEYDLFYFETLNDGANTSQKYKISISTLVKSNDPSNPYGTFTVQVRDFYDTDKNPVILEQYPKCTLNPDDDDYVAKRIGDQKSAFSFDALIPDERKSYTTGTRRNISASTRIVMHPNVELKKVPADALPFGFRGLPVVKTTDTLTDNTTVLAGLGSLTARRLAGSFPTADLTAHTGSILPPVPLRFKVTTNAVNSAGIFVGNPGNLELTDASYYWGVKSETVPLTGSVSNAILRSNDSSTFNPLLTSYSKLLGIQKLDVLVTGSAADSFANNKFTLARVALNNSLSGRSLVNALSDLTGTAEQHMLETAYIRNGLVNSTNYTVTPTGEGNRLTFASLYAVTSSIYFNKFTNYAKFTNIFTGGFDGLNILDTDISKMNDRAMSSETGGKAVVSVDIGLNPAYTPGAGTTNSIVTAFRTAAEILTNRYASGINVLAAPGARDSSITNYIAALVQNYGFAIYLMDIPGYDYSGTRLFDDTDRPDVQQTGNKFSSRRINNNFAAVYFPDVSMQDRAGSSRKIKVPSSVAALAAIGYNDTVSHPWYAPAGFNRGALNFVASTAVRLNSNDRDFLYDNRINPITSFPGTGYVIFGQKTLQVGKSALDRVNVRRLVNEVKRTVSNIANNFLFEQNNAATRAAFVAQVNPLLALVQAQQGIEGFRVIVDETNNTQTDAIANRLNGRVIIIPTRAVEFISIDFIVTDNGASFV
jgi:hypothetical protein